MTTEEAHAHRSVSRVLSVLKSFGPDKVELTVSEIRRSSRIPKTTAYRILSALRAAGMLEWSAETGKYRIGPELYMLGSLYLRTMDVIKAAEQVVKTLNDLSEEAASVAILDKGSVIFIIVQESKHAFRLHVHVGSILPAYASAMGKALLSELTNSQIEERFPEENLRPVTTKTVATKTDLKLILEQIRKTGVSFDTEGGYEGCEGIASVIRDATGKAVAAIAITAPLVRLDETIRARLASLVKLGSSLVSYRLGFRDTENSVRDTKEIISRWKQNVQDTAPK